MARITYTNKDKSQPTSDLRRLWTDVNANEVKASVNALYDKPYVEKSGAYTITINDYTINCNGTFNVTLLSAIGHTSIFNIKNSGNGIITVNTSLSQTIDGYPDIQLSPKDCLTVQSTNSNYIII